MAKTEQVRVALDPHERYRLDRYARRMSISQSEAVRIALSMLFKAEDESYFRRRRCHREWLIDAIKPTAEQRKLLMGELPMPPEPPDEMRLELDRDELRFIIKQTRANMAEHPEYRRPDLERRIETAQNLVAEAEALLAMRQADTTGYLASLDTPREPGVSMNCTPYPCRRARTRPPAWTGTAGLRCFAIASICWNHDVAP